MTMTRLSEQLEREAEIARSELAGDLNELRHRMTPGQIVDEAVGYARDTPLAEFVANLGRDIRQNPLPLLLIGAGIAWAMLNTARTSRPITELPESPLERRRQPAPALERGEWEVAAVTPAAD
jgi:hypothetical protein